MSERQVTSGDSKVNGNHIAIPHHPEELYGYFAGQADADPATFGGYAELAAEAADAIDLAQRYGKTDEIQIVDIALAPGSHSGVSIEGQTAASKQLLELIIFAHKLSLRITETTDEVPYGRTLYQSTDGSGINLIETRWRESAGDMVKLTAVSHVPEDILPSEEFAQPKNYDKRTQKAIRIAKSFQNIAKRQLKEDLPEEVEDELDYLVFVRDLPAVDFESPYDQAA